MREIRTLRATWRGLETWNGRDASADRRASPRPYLGAPGGEIPLGDSTCVTNTSSEKGGVELTRDGGRPPETGSQVQVSNHCKLLSSKAMVVSVAAKGGIKSRQVWSGEASESQPSMTCRNSIGDVKTGGAIFSRDQRGGGPEACPSGIRHVGGAKPDQAVLRNVRTCRPDAKGEVQAAKTARTRVPMRGTGAEQCVVGQKVL